MSSSIRLSGEQSSDIVASIASVSDHLADAQQRIMDGENVHDILVDVHEAHDIMNSLVKALEDISNGS